jgi:glycine cleavage system aminomethyltransferase T
VDAKHADCLGGETILAGGEQIGAVSSGAWGPSVDASLEILDATCATAR